MSIQAVVILLAFIQFAQACLLISLLRRMGQAETRLRIMHRQVVLLNKDVNTLIMWISPNHQLPKDIQIQRIVNDGA